MFHSKSIDNLSDHAQKGTIRIKHMHVYSKIGRFLIYFLSFEFKIKNHH